MNKIIASRLIVPSQLGIPCFPPGPHSDSLRNQTPLDNNPLNFFSSKSEFLLLPEISKQIINTLRVLHSLHYNLNYNMQKVSQKLNYNEYQDALKYTFEHFDSNKDSDLDKNEFTKMIMAI
jgi:hypothetical protein